MRRNGAAYAVCAATEAVLHASHNAQSISCLASISSTRFAENVQSCSITVLAGAKQRFALGVALWAAASGMESLGTVE